MNSKLLRWILIGVVVISAVTGLAAAAAPHAVQHRIDTDLAKGKPIVIQVVVALCDNAHQGIIPVPPALGDGQNPQSNLYWGAAYGFRTHFTRRAGFKIITAHHRPGNGLLQKIILHKQIVRSGESRDVFIVGEAWDGGEMKSAVNRFLSMAAGWEQTTEVVELENKRFEIASGGSAALVAFVGHNGLMDFPLASEPTERPGAPARSSIVLACVSKPYFLDVLRRGGSHPLLLTTGLMAPEAYTVDAVVHAFVRGESAQRIRDAAARAYHRYQKCGLSAANRLFFTPEG